MGSLRSCGRALTVVFGLAFVVSALCGCAEVVFHRAGSRRYTALPPDCRIRLVASPPESGYDEIGLLAIDGPAGSFRDPDEFVRAARPQVCRAGGEIVVTQINGLGAIVRGVVLRRRPVEPAAEAEAQAEPDGDCDPICSPGFACTDGKCRPQCNPACEAGETCGRDRLCHAREDKATAPAQE